MQFTKLKDGRVVNRECRYIVIHPIGKEYEITLGVEVLAITNSVDNAMKYVASYINNLRRMVC